MACKPTYPMNESKTRQVLEALKDTPAEAEARALLEPKLGGWKAVIDHFEKSPFLSQFTSPSFHLEKFPAGKQIVQIVDKGLRKLNLYVEGHVKSLKENIRFADESPESVALGYALELPDGHANLAKLPPEIIKARAWMKKQFEVHADEYGLEKTHRVKNYLPHMFDQDLLRAGFLKDLEAAAKQANMSPEALLALDKNALKATLDAESVALVDRAKAGLKMVQDGEGMLYEHLPQSIRFRFLESRLGKEGYSFDAVKAYLTYLTGLGRKMHLSETAHVGVPLLEQLPSGYRAFGKQYLRDVLGFSDRIGDPVDRLAQRVKELQFMRTIGFNPRTAVVNVFQQMFSAAEIGPKSQAVGWKTYMTPAGKELFRQSGHTTDVPNMWLGEVNPLKARWQRFVDAAGWMFNQVETANRGTTYLGALHKWYVKQGSKLAQTFGDMVEKASFPEEAKTFADDMVRKTQFRYGKADLPMAFRKGVVGAAFQFSTFPIKAMELMWKWGVRERNSGGWKKLGAVLAANAGLVGAGQSLFGVELKGATGAPVDLLEVADAFASVTEGDYKQALRHLGKSADVGFRFGPSATLLTDVQGIATRAIEGQDIGKFSENFLMFDLEPVVIRRAWEAYKDLENGGNVKDFIMYGLGFPNDETFVRRTYMKLVEQGKVNVAKELLDAYQKQRGSLPLNFAKVREIRSEMKRERKAHKQDQKQENPSDRISKRFNQRIERILL